jgi:hypothetical protein
VTYRPFLCNGSVNTFPRERTRATIRRRLLGNSSVNTPKTIRDNRRYFPWGPPLGYITRSSKGAVNCQKLREFRWSRVYLSWFRFWDELWVWHSKVTEKNWQKGIKTVTRTLHVWFEVTVRLLKSRCQDMPSEGWERWCVCNGEL